MQSQVISESFTIDQADVLYVAQQINLDLRALSQAYPQVLSQAEAMNLFIAYSTFLANYAISRLGFSIDDPADSNLVYHEYRYDVLYGGDVRRFNPDGHPMGRGGKPINRVNLPASARFTPWIVWSSSMKKLSIHEQELIVSGTGWDVPSRSSSFNGRYEGGNWNSLGFIGRGSIGVSLNEYRRDR